MSSRGKLSDIKSGDAPIKLSNISHDDRVIILKDRHLLDAAIASDRIILSLEKKVIKALERTGNKKMLDEFTWLNPLNINDEVLFNL